MFVEPDHRRRSIQSPSSGSTTRKRRPWRGPDEHTALDVLVPPTPLPDVPAERLVRVTVALDLRTAAQGNLVRADINVTNISDRVVHLKVDTDCGDGFGSVAAPGVEFGPGGDQCSRGPGEALLPGAKRGQTAYTYVPEGRPGDGSTSSRPRSPRSRTECSASRASGRCSCEPSVHTATTPAVASSAWRSASRW